MSLRVLVAGGGTAGHIEPALNLADTLTEMRPDTTVTALGTAKGLETTLVPARGYELALIPPVPLPRSVNKDLFSLPGRLRAAVAQTRGVLDERRIDVVVGFGGYAALPAYLAARRNRVPIVVHEANAKAGLANRVGARLTHFVAETYPGSLPGAELVGLPLRRSISSLDRAAERSRAREFFGLDPHRPVLFVFGGSQGARHINEAVVAAAAQVVAAGGSVLHSVGSKNGDQRPAEEIEHFVTVDYVDRMDLAYAAADLALCRAGAMTVAELSAVGLPAVFVPLPVGNGEQRRNAAAVIAAGGGIEIPDGQLDSTAIIEEVLPVLTDPQVLNRMSAAAATQGVRDAGEILAQMTFSAAATGRAAGTTRPAEAHTEDK